MRKGQERGALLPLALPRHGQHILDEDAVAAGGVVQQHMGHRAYDAAVLQDGTAAHG